MAMPQEQDGNLNNYNGQCKVLNLRAGEKTLFASLQRNLKHDFTPAGFSRQVSFISDQFHVHVLTEIQSVPLYKTLASARMTYT